HTHSAGGVIVKDGRVIVVNQKGRSWSLPKGHIEDGEDADAAAIREIAEETGVTDLTLIGDLGSYSRYKIGKDPKEEDRTELKTMHMFLFSTEEENLKPTDPDNPEARWIKKDDVADMLTHLKDKEFYLSIIDRI
ncbi:MAG: NUDIX domain-containing protein, partial [Candidatus Aenigmarchaeota archaeon]|nr:NUDIX domain-containing protein [Candidatus Aenigmarchaeota archaeon]MCK5373344.1 NUDIX domain-containing protein [Candidatus Aenigmarchaeota archaeon]